MCINGCRYIQAALYLCYCYLFTLSDAESFYDCVSLLMYSISCTILSIILSESWILFKELSVTKRSPIHIQLSAMYHFVIKLIYSIFNFISFKLQQLYTKYISVRLHFKQFQLEYTYKQDIYIYIFKIHIFEDKGSI